MCSNMIVTPKTEYIANIWAPFWLDLIVIKEYASLTTFCFYTLDLFIWITLFETLLFHLEHYYSDNFHFLKIPYSR